MRKKGGEIFFFVFPIVILGIFYTQKLEASAPSVNINEVCWMGGVESANDEWIEIKNNTDSDIDLNGWILEAIDGSPIIILEGIIPALGYFLLERSDDDTVLGVAADLIYFGALGNDGEELKLRDGDDNLIDNILINEEGWPGGDNETKQTMERVGDNWQTSVEVGGTPKRVNSLVEENSENGGGSEDNTEIGNGGEIGNLKLEIGDDVKSVSKASKEDVIINEIFSNPRGSDREWEFIELYNRGDNGVDLTGWRLENERGKVYEFGKFDDFFEIEIKNVISPKGFLAIFRSVSNLALDNNGGEIRLFARDKKTAKQVLKYDKAEEGLAYINSETIDLEKITTSTKNFLLNSTKIGEWVWTCLPTPGKTNQVEGVNNAPKISFSIPEKIKSGESVFFDSSDTVDEDGDELEFTWDFGDGIKLNLAEPSHTFLTPGIYEVKLEVSDGKQSNLLQKKINVLGELGEIKEELEKNNIINNEGEYDFSWIDEVDLETYYNLPKFVPAGEFVETPLSEMRNVALKTNVKTRGTVIVEPGVFGSQYFYIAGSNAFKVYNYKKEFPDISLGDVVEAQGEISEANNEKYLKTKDLGDIKIIDKTEQVIPEKIDSLNEEYLYRLVEIEGEILEKKNPRIYLGVGAGEIREENIVYIKSSAGIDLSLLEEGAWIRIAGLVLKISDDLALMPRNNSDIVLVEKEVKGEVVQAEENIEEWSLEPEDKKNNLYKYLLVVGIGGVIVLVILYIKKKKAIQD